VAAAAGGGSGDYSECVPKWLICQNLRCNEQWLKVAFAALCCTENWRFASYRWKQVGKSMIPKNIR